MKGIKAIVRIAPIFLLVFALLGTTGIRTFAQDGETDLAATPVAETETATPVETEEPVVTETATAEPEAPAATATPDDSVEPAAIGEEPGGNVIEENGRLKLVSDMSNATPYAFVNIPIPSGTSFADLAYIGATIEYEADDSCGGGSPRFSVDIDTDGDGTANGQINIYVGAPPNFTGCTTGDTGNLLSTTDTRFDLTQLGGAYYATYADALAAFDEDTVVGLGFYVDGGWFFGDGEQAVLVDAIAGLVSEVNGIASLQITKVAAGGDDPAILTGACFEIYANDGGARGELIAAEQCDDDNDGLVDFLGLPADVSVVIVETVAPDGYDIAPDQVEPMVEGDNFVRVEDELLPTPTATATATETATATATATTTVTATATATATKPPAPTATTTVTKLPSTGAGESSGFSTSAWLLLLGFVMMAATGVSIGLRRRS